MAEFNTRLHFGKSAVEVFFFRLVSTDVAHGSLKFSQQKPGGQDVWNMSWPE